MTQNNSSAQIHGVGLFLAIAALFVSGIAAGMAFMVFLSGRDQVANVKDEVMKIQTQLKDQEIQLDDLKSQK